MDDATREQLDTITAELRAWWQAALVLNADRDAWQHMAPALRRYRAGSAIARWYHDSLLIRCRRLIGTRKDERSLVRTLVSLERVAPRVTVDYLVSVRSDHAGDWSAGEIERDAQATLDQLVGVADSPALTRATVTRERERLTADYKQLATFASRVVAHDPVDRSGVPSLAWEDLGIFLDDILDVVRRFALMLEGVTYWHEAPDMRDPPFVRALELFDWPVFVEAAAAEDQRRWGLGARPPDASERVEREVRVEFVWPDQS